MASIIGYVPREKLAGIGDTWCEGCGKPFFSVVQPAWGGNDYNGKHSTWCVTCADRMHRRANLYAARAERGAPIKLVRYYLG